MENDKIIEELFNKYLLNDKDREYLIKIIMPIYNHSEFQNRMKSEFAHHGKITLGEHIIEDAILTYILSKKYMNKKKYYNYRMDLAIKIAMLHDLYCVPWQNNKEEKGKRFFNKHGFRHPIEAVINAINWYPELFYNENDNKIIIDGIVHHMFPLPVRTIKNIDKIELKNRKLYDNLSYNEKESLKNSLKRKRIGPISFTRSIYMEGKVMSKADKKVSRRELNNFKSFKALLTGRNKMLDK